MSKDESKQKLAGPWRSIHAAVWLIGLAILFYTGNWWPGILVLIAISGVVEALIRRYAPGAVEDEAERAVNRSSACRFRLAGCSAGAARPPRASSRAFAFDLPRLWWTHPRA